MITFNSVINETETTVGSYWPINHPQLVILVLYTAIVIIDLLHAQY